MQREYSDIIGLAVGLMIVVPIVTVLLGELIDRLRSRENQYARFLEVIRGVLLPTVVVYIISRYLLELNVVASDESGESFQRILYPLTLTALYVVLAYSFLEFLSVLKREKDPQAWENRIPGLFKAVSTILVIAVPTYLILDTWGVLVGDFAKYASLVLAATAFALQDALSSITKGFLLVLDKPFAVGDWIEVDGVKGKVIDISWRSTRLQVSGKDVVVMPNLIISDSSVYNFTAEDISYRDDLIVRFSHEDSPSRVKQVLMGVLADCAEVMKIPTPRIYTISYDDFSVSYKIYYFVQKYVSAMEQERIRDDIMSRVWYAADRHGLTLPYPVQIHGTREDFAPDLVSIRQEVFTFLRSNRYFSCLSENTLLALSNETEVVRYSANETLFRQGDMTDVVGLIRSGQVSLTVGNGSASEVVELAQVNDVIGEIALLGKRAHPTTALALRDTEVLHFSQQALGPIIEKNAKFAGLMNGLIESRMETKNVDWLEPRMSVG